MENIELREVYNFSAGPSQFPREVLLKAQEEFLSVNGCGFGVVELSHRSKEYMDIHNRAESSLRKLLEVPSNYKILFLQGGATTQFASICLNLMKENKTANYLVTAHWGEKAIEECKKYGNPVEVVPMKQQKANKYTGCPDPSEWKYEENAAFFHYCDNETIAGIEFGFVPDVPGQTLVCDMSSNFCSRPVDVSKFGLIYAGAQKNVGPSGVTIVIVREDLLGNAMDICPTLMDYNIQAGNESLYNTGPTFGIYLCGLYFDYLLKKGGLQYWDEQSKLKSQTFYDYIDQSNGFYKVNVKQGWRSRMNIPFVIVKDGKNDTELEAKFLVDAKNSGCIQLSGHKSVGGCRASFYNGMPLEGVQQLIKFMKKFAEENQ